MNLFSFGRYKIDRLKISEIFFLYPVNKFQKLLVKVINLLSFNW